MDLRLLRYFLAVADERHVGRAAARLHMTQPPLSRAIKQLEADLGVTLLHRTSSGVSLTAAGDTLYAEARALVEQSERLRSRVSAAAGPATLSIGTLADSADDAGTLLAAAFRERHREVEVRIREADLTDPTTGLRAARVDVALTRAPFDTTGMSTRVLRADPVGVVLRSDDPLAGREAVRLAELAGRRWFQFPEGVDPLWRAYWSGPAGSGGRHDGPVVRTVHECLQAVLWNGSVGLMPRTGHPLPDAMTVVPLTDMPPSRLVIAWMSGTTNPLVHSFARLAADIYRSHP